MHHMWGTWRGSQSKGLIIEFHVTIGCFLQSDLPAFMKERACNASCERTAFYLAASHSVGQLHTKSLDIDKDLITHPRTEPHNCFLACSSTCRCS